MEQRETQTNRICIQDTSTTESRLKECAGKARAQQTPEGPLFLSLWLSLSGLWLSHSGPAIRATPSQVAP